MLAAAAGPFVLTVSALYANIDYLYYPLEILLPDPKYRSLETILGAVIIRLVCVLWGSLECGRAASLFIYLFFMIINRFLRTLKILMSQVYTFSGFYGNYIYVTLLYRKTEQLCWIITYILLSTTFWILVASCWIVVKGSIEKVTLPLYFVFVLTALIIFALYAAALPIVCKGLEMAIEVVALQELRARFRYARLKCRLVKAEIKTIKAIKPIKLTYGMFWQLRMSFLGEYFWLIVLRTFDAILIIDF